MLALFLSNDKTPNFLIFDEPVSHLDTFHLLNLLDILRELSINGTQIFFTTSNPNTSKLFRRKFSFLGSAFMHFKLSDEQIELELHSINIEIIQVN
jgi:ABC-type multidrug transport system ATPase subunit